MRLFFSIISGLLLLLNIGCSKVEDDYASIVFFIGDVKKNNIDAEIDDILLQSDIIITGENSSCDIKIGGSIIRVKEKTKMIVSELNKKNNLENTTIGLDFGKVLCRTKKLLKSEDFLVKTPTSVAGVRGTNFSVESDSKKTAKIKVYRGKVKVAKRIKQFEKKIEELLDVAPAVKNNEKVQITEKEVKQAEKIVEKVLKKEKGKEKDLDAALLSTIKKVNKEINISKKDIKKFEIDLTKKEDKEIARVKPKPKAVIKKIKKVIKIAKEKPKPEGRILVTRFEVYLIKDGKVIWEGKVVRPPVSVKDKIYIASEDYVFCALKDGPVLWKKALVNDGDLRIEKNRILVSSKGKATKLNMKDGNIIR